MTVHDAPRPAFQNEDQRCAHIEKAVGLIGEDQLVVQNGPARAAIFMGLGKGFLVPDEIRDHAEEFRDPVAHRAAAPQFVIAGAHEQQMIVVGQQVAQFVGPAVGDGGDPAPRHGQQFRGWPDTAHACHASR